MILSSNWIDKAPKRRRGRPPGSKTHPNEGGRKVMGRPQTLHKRYDCPAKLVLMALGGVHKTWTLMYQNGMPYTKAAIYRWLTYGYIPHRVLYRILELCRRGGIPLPAPAETLIMYNEAFTNYIRGPETNEPPPASPIPKPIVHYTSAASQPDWSL